MKVQRKGRSSATVVGTGIENELVLVHRGGGPWQKPPKAPPRRGALSHRFGRSDRHAASSWNQLGSEGEDEHRCRPATRKSRMEPYPTIETGFVATVPRFLTIPEVHPRIVEHCKVDKTLCWGVSRVSLGDWLNRMALGRLKRSEWGQIEESARRNFGLPFRQVSIDSIFFRGTLKTQAHDSYRIVFLG